MMNKILIVLLVAVLDVARGDALYPHGAAAGDTFETAGDDDHIEIFTDNYRFYGEDYTKLYLNPNGPASFDEPFDNFSPSTTPRPEPFLSVFWDDITIDFNTGHVSHRKVTSGPDVTQAAADLLAAGHTNPIDHVTVITWFEVQEYGSLDEDPKNTFQLVLVAGADCTMFSIFNYGAINWGFNPVAGFNKGDSVDFEVLDVLDTMATAHLATNINEPGRIVKRVDSADFTQTPDSSPEGCAFTCTSTTSGVVLGYHGDSEQLAANTKPVFTKAQEDDTDPCKFLVDPKTDENGNIEWLAINVGVHENNTRHRRSFAFNKPDMKGLVLERGQGVTSHPINLPYPWTDGSTSVLITQDADGWTLESTSGCGYSFFFGPSGTEPVLTSTLQYSSIPIIDGACGSITPT